MTPPTQFGYDPGGWLGVLSPAIRQIRHASRQPYRRSPNLGVRSLRGAPTGGCSGKLRIHAMAILLVKLEPVELFPLR